MLSHFSFNLFFLQFKERDELAKIFKSWTSSSSSQHAAPVSMSKAWDYRVRQHLGSRYDSREGCFDWDLHMKLHKKGVNILSLVFAFHFNDELGGF